MAELMGTGRVGSGRVGLVVAAVSIRGIHGLWARAPLEQANLFEIFSNLNKRTNFSFFVHCRPKSLEMTLKNTKLIVGFYVIVQC